jgi:hypothetical protein
MEIIALQQNDSNERPSNWAMAAANDRPAPRPTSQASPELVAHWLHEIAVFDWAAEITTESINKWCRERGIEPRPVMGALRNERSGRDVYSTYAVTNEVQESVWDDMDTNRETACCPVPMWIIEATTGRQQYHFDDCDDSLRCRDHARRKTDAIRSAARLDWLGLDVVYYAAVPHDSGVINRVRSTRRPGRKNAKSWYVVRRDRKGWTETKVVHLFATRDLSGPGTQKPPRSWGAAPARGGHRTPRCPRHRPLRSGRGARGYREASPPASSTTCHIRVCSATDMWGSNTFHATTS